MRSLFTLSRKAGTSHNTVFTQRLCLGHCDAFDRIVDSILERLIVYWNYLNIYINEIEIKSINELPNHIKKVLNNNNNGL